ncbi:hypothetical protein MPLDJ20_130057 [Mesorhizobium plurifarium]|uniref:Uncharacterized protein n=1 Tax=Mesorhizobium plurifarium TaxID=69974 RepID=A0A090GGF4_MESPL|nr:hypothetical protein MPLDJ20_130057 [Mesorhizobium plurifarium]
MPICGSSLARSKSKYLAPPQGFSRLATDGDRNRQLATDEWAGGPSLCLPLHRALNYLLNDLAQSTHNAWAVS